MTGATETSEQLLDRLTRMPFGTAHREFAASVIAVANERGDEALEFDARQRLVADGFDTGATDLALANFAWCAATYDKGPEWFDNDGGMREFDFFWQHKGMAGLLDASNAFSREQVDAILDEIEARFIRAGNGMYAVVESRLGHALAINDLPAARRFADQLASLERDEYSSCPVCVPANYVELAIAEGDVDKAIDIALDTWRSGRTCSTEPAQLLAQVHTHMLERGRVDQAVEVFHAIRDQVGQDRDRPHLLALCAQFASLTGNHDTAIALVERHLGWLATDALNDVAHLQAAKSFAVALERAARHYGGDTVLIRASTDPGLVPFIGEVDEPLTVGELAERMWALADRLASQFDALDGGSDDAHQVGESRKLVTMEYPASLGDMAGFAPLVVVPPRPQSANDWWTRMLAAQAALDSQAAATAAANVLELADKSAAGVSMRWGAHSVTFNAARANRADAWVQSARKAWQTFARRGVNKHAQGVAVALTEPRSPDDVAREVLAAKKVPDLMLAAALMEAVALKRTQEQAPSAEGAAWRSHTRHQAQLLLERVGDRASAPERMYAASLAAAIRIDEALDLGSVAQDPAAARAVLDEVNTGSWPGLREALAGRVAATRAQIAAWCQDEAAAPHHEQAASAFAQAGLPVAVRTQSINAATAHMRVGDFVNGLARMEFAISLYGPDDEVPFHVRWLYSQALVGAGEGYRALRMLTTIIEEERAAGESAGMRAPTHLELAKAYVQADDPRAHDEFALATDLFIEDQMWAEAAEATLLQPGDDLTRANRARELAVRAQSPELELRARMQRVRIQVRADDPAWLADADQALSLLRSVSDKELELATLEELGYCHLQAGNHTVGIEMLSQHAEALRDRDGVDAYVEAVATVAWEAHEEGATQAALSLLRDAWPRLDSVHAQQEFLESTEHIVTGTPLQPEWERWHAQTHRENTA